MEINSIDLPVEDRTIVTLLHSYVDKGKYLVHVVVKGTGLSGDASTIVTFGQLSVRRNP